MTDEAERERRRDEINKGWMTVARVADVVVEHRDHEDDGMLTAWSRNMPKKPPPPTIEEVRQLIAEAAAQGDAATGDVIGEMRQQLRAEIDSKGKAIAQLVVQRNAKLRKELRAEIKARTSRPAEEFFYTDDNGNKQDADLHNAIIGPVDHPIDEKIMAPIRERNRAKFLAERSARVIDLPALPLRGSRHG